MPSDTEINQFCKPLNALPKAARDFLQFFPFCNE